MIVPIQYVLDTDTLTLFQEGHPTVCAEVLRHSPGKIAITVLSVEEQISGWYTQVRQAKRNDRISWAYRRLIESINFLAKWPILPYEETAIHRFESLRQQKIRIGRTDLRIAATVLEAGATLVTENLHDFKQVPELKIVSWTRTSL